MADLDARLEPGVGLPEGLARLNEWLRDPLTNSDRINPRNVPILFYGVPNVNWIIPRVPKAPNSYAP